MDAIEVLTSLSRTLGSLTDLLGANLMDANLTDEDARRGVTGITV